MTINNESLNELGVRWGMFSDADNFHKVAAKFDSFGLEHLSSHLNVNFSTSSGGCIYCITGGKNSRAVADLELKALEQENNCGNYCQPTLINI